ncbi:MAG: DUF1840 domain-containing protein [Aquabacterium sp.]|uniref:DUF1840 domain-containing protein n=1 Tax=Aquabacterium sp. TaxID=1872578 RepID=UPI0025C65CBC|nr:DUF1840 domain-containing protein [Aquabacterium sp.]MBI5924881.1 DUF1840 domain-containing protein [Aquabacterium sp.]
MALTFKSQATGNLIMVQAHALALLKVIGKADQVKGVLEPADMPAALLALRELSDEPIAPVAENETEPSATPELSFPDEFVSLRKRAWPLIKMIEEAQGADKPIVWGV